MKNIINKIKIKLGIVLLGEKISQIEDRMSMFERFVDVGIDVNVRSNSWAVVCLHGKMDYINLYEINDKSAKELRYFLKYFSESNKVIDASPFMQDMF
jgi:hypothetical protein